MDRLPELVVAVIVAAFAAALAGCAMPDSEVEWTYSRVDDETLSYDVAQANGCPLDAVVYDAPKFANKGSKSLKVVDRFSKQEWWLVKMGTEWVVLPIESKEASE